jgi:hypothetical protein
VSGREWAYCLNLLIPQVANQYTFYPLTQHIFTFLEIEHPYNCQHDWIIPKGTCLRRFSTDGFCMREPLLGK